ncbi:hypothetical protein F2Q68_00017001 [Brassica cretica]|uniref:Uncharacterized protein n=1 Tax=Brassica cretica TaxID=69181 RepID=A0A8S9HC11_BRACR|nr:hypothetical protein F2Q68_00017001 [Brassica cretica]
MIMEPMMTFSKDQDVVGGAFSKERNTLLGRCGTDLVSHFEEGLVSHFEEHSPLGPDPP